MLDIATGEASDAAGWPRAGRLPWSEEWKPQGRNRARVRFATTQPRRCGDAWNSF